MEEPRVCRVCLVVGVRMYDVKCDPVKNYLEAIVGLNPLGTMLLPSYVCYECEALARKYFLFKEKCMKGQAALYEMLSHFGKINVDEIAQVRQNFKLASSLIQDNQNQLIEYCYEETNCLEESKEEDEVKEEIYEDHSLHFSDTLEAEDLLESIKEEDDRKEFEVFLNSPVSSDDEPLSTHKRNKTESEKRAKANGDIATTSDAPVKRKRGRPRKNEVRPKIEIEEDRRKRKSRRRNPNHTGAVSVEDDVDLDIENYVDIIILSPKEQLAEIEKRKESTNYQNAAFQCEFCFKGFIDAAAWDHHRAKHEPSAGNISCPVCKVRFKNKRSYMKHYANHEKRYQCKACPYVSKTSTQAKQHQRWHKGVTYKCQHCDEVSTKWTSYLSHVRMKHPSEFICNICGYSFVSRLGLTMHRTMMHKENEEAGAEANAEESGQYCAECDVTFGSDEAFKRHIVMSSKHLKEDDDMFGCRACGQRCGSAEELRVHHRTLHARKRPRNYGKRPPAHAWPKPCTLCGEQVSCGRAYWTHFRRAHPGLPYPVRKDYVCDVCGKSFRGNAFLVYHKRTHSAERAYQCAQCPKAFHNRTNLHIHQRTHSDLRPHACSVCAKAFKSKGALDRHFRSHTGVKPYECEVCGKAFNQSNSRKLHVRTVHLRQPSPYVSRNRSEKRRRETPFELISQV